MGNLYSAALAEVVPLLEVSRRITVWKRLFLEDPTQAQSVEPIALRGHESNISSSQISPDEKFVLTFSGADRDNGGGAEKLLRLWDLEKMRLDPRQSQ